MQIEVVDQIAQILRHALNGRLGGARQPVPAMAARIPANHAVPAGQLLDEWKPLLMAGRPAVQHQYRAALAGHLEVNFFTVVGKEMGHREVRQKEEKKKTRSVSQALGNGNYNRPFFKRKRSSWIN
jgi:hypothetical protein